MIPPVGRVRGLEVQFTSSKMHHFQVDSSRGFGKYV